MSSKTKIVVLKARELIYTGIFILLGILLILLLIFMFVPSHKSKKTTETSGYTQGVYSSPLKLGENELELSVTVKDGKARSISLKHLNKSIKTMYPLIEPSLNEINKQLPKPQLGVRVSLPLLRKQIEFYLVCFLFYRKRKRMSDFTL